MDGGLTVLLTEIAQGGPIVLLGWMIYYLFTKTFPDHAETLKDARDAYMASLEEIRKEFRVECEMTREVFRRALDDVAAAIGTRNNQEK